MELADEVGVAGMQSGGEYAGRTVTICENGGKKTIKIEVLCKKKS